jgi:hypothetical protein
VLGSINAGPVYGQGSGGAAASTAGADPASAAAPHAEEAPSSHAPVDVRLTGSTHGMQSSPVAHVAWGIDAALLATSGRQTLRHAPGSPPTEVQLAGFASPDSESVSGTQKPPTQAAKSAWLSAGTPAAGTQ